MRSQYAFQCFGPLSDSDPSAVNTYLRQSPYVFCPVADSQFALDHFRRYASNCPLDYGVEYANEALE